MPPSRFEAVAEALAAGEDPHDVCSEVGRLLATDGASLEEALGGLRDTWRRVCGSDPSYDAISALLSSPGATQPWATCTSCPAPTR